MPSSVAKPMVSKYQTEQVDERLIEDSMIMEYVSKPSLAIFLEQ